MRVPTREELTYERLGERFDSALSVYDTRRRVETLIDEFLADEVIAGKTALDVGCGLGFFSERLKRRGARVTACDIAPTLVERTERRVGCASVVADVMELTDSFGTDCFDLVVSSECIEHTPDPHEALLQLAAVLKPGGYLSISTPNVVWSPIVRTVTALGLRPFDGHENFSSWCSVQKTLQSAGIDTVRERGLHLFPFQFQMERLSTWCDGHLQTLRGLMINICVLGRKHRS